MNTGLLQSRGLTSLTPALTPLQSQVDGLVGGFVHQATDWHSLAAMMAGGMAYRVGRIGVMSASGHVAAVPLRVASVGFGLAAEVSTFELAHRGLTTLSGRGGPMWPPAPESTIGGRPHGGAPTNPGESNLWRWSGPGGLRQGLLQSFLTFGALKSAGRIARGENFVAQHLLQDTAMVLGHQTAGDFGIAPAPTGTLAEQFLHAEATNLQIGAGMALAHRFAPGLQALERGLDLSLPRMDVGANLSDSANPSGFLRDPAQPGLSVFSRNGIRDGRSYPFGHRQGSPLQPEPALAAAGGEGETPNREPTLQNPQKSSVIAMSNLVEQETPSLGTLERISPAESIPSPSREIQYPPEIARILDRLEGQMTAPDYLEGSREDLLGRRASEEDVDQVWFYHLAELARRYPEIRVTTLDAEVLKEEIPQQARKDLPTNLVVSERVDQALNELGPRNRPGSVARRVLEIGIPTRLIKEDHGQRSQKTATGLSIFDLVFHGETGLNHETHLIHLKDEMEFFRMPSLSLTDRLQQAVHSGRTRHFYVWGTPPRDQVMRLRGLRLPPVGISRDFIYLEDVEHDVHPASLAIHDAYFHAVRDQVEVADPIPEIAARVYESLSVGKNGNNFFRENLLKELSDFRFFNQKGDVREFLQTTLLNVSILLSRAPKSQSPETPEQLKQARDFLDFYLERAQSDFPSHPRLAGELDFLTQEIHCLQKAIEQVLPRFIEYPPDIAALLDHVEGQMNDPEYLRGTREELLAKRVDEEAADRIFLHQVLRLAQSSPDFSVKILDADVLRERAPRRDLLTDEIDPRYLDQAITRLGSRGQKGSVARQVIEIGIPFSIFADPLLSGGEYGLDDRGIKAVTRKMGLFTYSQNAEDFLNHVVHLSHEDGEAFIYYRIIAPSLLERLLQAVHGEDSVQFHSVWGTIDRDDAAHLRTVKAPPIGFVRYPTFLEDLGDETDPANFTLHDLLFHAPRDARIRNPYPELSGWVYQTVQKGFPDSALKEKLLNILSDLEISRVPPNDTRAFLTETLSPGCELWRSVGSTIPRGKGLQAMNEALAFHENYRNLLIPLIRKHPLLGSEVESFARELDNTIRNMRRALNSCERCLQEFAVTPSFLQESLPQLSDPHSALSEDSRRDFRKILETSLQGEPPLSSTPALLLATLQKDFANRLVQNGMGQQSLKPLEDGTFIAGIGIQEPAWMGALSREVFGSDLFQEISIPPEAEETLKPLLSLPLSTLKLLGPELGLPENALYSEENGQKILRLPPVGLLLRAARGLYGANAVRINFTSRMNTPEEAEALLADDARPWLLTSLPQSLHDVKGVHPYVAALHDLYHILRVSRIDPEVRAHFVQVHDAFKTLRPYVDENELIDLLMASIYDGNLGATADYRSFFRFVRLNAPGDTFIRALKMNLETRFSYAGTGRSLLDAYQQEMVRPHLERLGERAGAGERDALLKLAEWSPIDGEGQRIFREAAERHRNRQFDMSPGIAEGGSRLEGLYRAVQRMGSESLSKNLPTHLSERDIIRDDGIPTPLGWQIPEVLHKSLTEALAETDPARRTEDPEEIRALFEELKRIAEERFPPADERNREQEGFLDQIEAFSPSFPLEITYRPEVSALLSRFEGHVRAAGYLEGTREELLLKRPDADWVDEIFFQQALDLVGRFPYVKVRVMDDRSLLEDLPEFKDSPNPELVRRARELLGHRGAEGGAARRILEVRFDRGIMADIFDQQDRRLERNLSLLSPLIEAQRTLKYGVHLITETADEVTARIPSLSYFEKLLQVLYGRERVQFHYVNGEIPRDLVMALRAKRISPIGISRHFIWLGDGQEWVLPLPFALHDGFFHGSLDSVVLPGRYEFSGRLYDWVGREALQLTCIETFRSRLADSDLAQLEDPFQSDLGTDILHLFDRGLKKTSQMGDLSQRHQEWSGLRNIVEDFAHTYQGLVRLPRPPDEPAGTLVGKLDELRRTLRGAPPP